MAIKNDTPNPQFYADLGSLQNLKSTARKNESEALKQVAQQFEQMFMSELMKSMRKANESFGTDNVFNSSETQFYQGMLDSQIALEMSQNQGFGLADVLVKQLSRQLDVRLDTEEEGERNQNLSDAEQLLNRALGQGAVDAANQAFSQLPAYIAQGLTEAPPSVTPVSETVDALVDELKSKFDSKVDGLLETVADKTRALLPERFESPEHFVESLLPLAEEVAGELGVDPKVLLAQAALETGWGKHIINNEEGSSYNLFNIKADRRWDGDKAQVSTLEYRDGVAQREQAYFRSYASYEQSFRDYVDFLKNSPRYQQALEMAADPKEYLQQLQQAGYATDPSYADKITNIFEGRILAMGLSGSKEG